MLEIEFEKLITLKTDTLIIDVRTPLEYQQGHIPTACNIPFLKNDDRVAVGKEYKKKGKTEAVKTGFRLIGAKISDMIVEVEKKIQKKQLIVYCWRGGMRSYAFCQFMEMAGIKTCRLRGGYKYYRTAALDFFSSSFHLIVLSGNTGTGKTDLLRELDRQGEQIIDLEKTASHKGSVFGSLGMPPQPTTEQFQNRLFDQLLTFDLSKFIWIEDESISIGKVFIPNAFWKAMRSSPIMLCNIERSNRIERLVREYGSIDTTLFHLAMTKIAKRLGGQHFKKATQQLKQKNMHAVMDTLLTYYDKVYSYNLNKRSPEQWHTLHWDGQSLSEAAKELIRVAKLKSNNRVHYE